MKNKSFVVGLLSGIFLTLIIAIVLHSWGVIGSNPSERTIDSHLAEPKHKDLRMKGTETGRIRSLPIDPSIGPKDAPIKIVEFADFHCAFCKRAYPTMQKLLDTYKDKIHYTFRHYPLSNLPGVGSFVVHQVAACVIEQGEDLFWDFHRKVFSEPGRVDKERAMEIGEEVGIKKVERFRNCVNKVYYKRWLLKQIERGKKAGVTGTPTFFINGEMISGAYPYEHFVEIIESELDPAKKKAKDKKRDSRPVVKFENLDGRASQGSKDAPVTLVEFSDFHCPFCTRVTPTIEKLMEQNPGKIHRVFRHYPLSFHKGAERTHHASECALEQGKFWEYHAKLFENTGKLKTDDALVRAATEVGLDGKKMRECLESNRYAELIKSDLKDGSLSGVRGTPAVFINGRMISGAQPLKRFQQEVDYALDPSLPPPASAAPRRREPRAMKPTTFTDLDDKPTQGSKDAPITIVEFSDFHCPFCTRALGTIKEIGEAYPDQVRFVFRHYPLSFHKGAERTHQASECAREQNQFWQYHDKLFQNTGKLRSDDALVKAGEEIGLDGGKLRECLESNRYEQLIKSEIAVGNKSGVRGTPAFFVNSKPISGAQPFSVFKEIIDEELKK